MPNGVAYKVGAGTSHNFGMAGALVSSTMGGTSSLPMPSAAAFPEQSQYTLGAFRNVLGKTQQNVHKEVDYQKRLMGVQSSCGGISAVSGASNRDRLHQQMSELAQQGHQVRQTPQLFQEHKDNFSDLSLEARMQYEQEQSDEMLDMALGQWKHQQMKKQNLFNMLPASSFATNEEQALQMDIARAAQHKMTMDPDCAAYSMVVSNVPNTLKYLRSRTRYYGTPVSGQINFRGTSAKVTQYLEAPFPAAIVSPCNAPSVFTSFAGKNTTLLSEFGPNALSPYIGQATGPNGVSQGNIMALQYGQDLQ